MKKQSIFNQELGVRIVVYSIARVCHQIIIHPIDSDEILCDNLVLFGTEFHALSSSCKLSPEELEIIRLAILEELPEYISWDNVSEEIFEEVFLYS